MIKKYVVSISVITVLVAVVVAFGAWIYYPGPLPAQPIAFNHKLHLERVQGIACVDCHVFVASQAYAGLPSKYICLDCHSSDSEEGDTNPDEFNPELASLQAFGKTEGDIPWQRVTASHADVFFSHRRHVTVAKLDCRECHPKIPDRDTPPTRGPIVMSMGTCIDCHEENKASVDCVSCHW